MAEKRKSKGKLRSMSIEPHEKEGFTVRHDMNSGERGVYEEPETHIMKNHGELMNHVHDHMSKHGSKEPEGDERDCPFCSTGSDEKDETQGTED
jgi:hypothetical protein